MFKLTRATAGAWPSEQGEAVPCHCIHHPAVLALKAIRPQQALWPATRIGQTPAPLLRHGHRELLAGRLNPPPELTPDSREVSPLLEFLSSLSYGPHTTIPTWRPSLRRVALETQLLTCVVSQAASSSLACEV